MKMAGRGAMSVPRSLQKRGAWSASFVCISAPKIKGPSGQYRLNFSTYFGEGNSKGEIVMKDAHAQSSRSEAALADSKRCHDASVPTPLCYTLLWASTS